MPTLSVYWKHAQRGLVFRAPGQGAPIQVHMMRGTQDEDSFTESRNLSDYSNDESSNDIHSRCIDTLVRPSRGPSRI